MVLSFENSHRKRIDIVRVLHRYGVLQDNRTAVKLSGYQVDRRAGPLHPMFPRLILRIRSRERREQRWVDIDDSVREFIQEDWGEHTHEAGEAHETDSSRLQYPRKLP